MYYASLNDETEQTHSMTRLLAVINRFEISYTRGLNKLYSLDILLCYLALVMKIAYFVRNIARIVIHT